MQWSESVINKSTKDNDFTPPFLNLKTVFSNSTPEKFANISQTESDGIEPMKFETARTHFLICAQESFAYQQQFPYLWFLQTEFNK